MKTKKRVTSVTFSPTVDSGRARIWTQVRQNLYSSNHHHADLWGRARVWPACWVHRTEGQKEKHVLLLQCLLLSGLSARWSFGEPNPSHLLLSASDILIKCFGSLYHTIKMLSTFLSLGKKKCKLKFLSTLQIPAIDFCSWFEPTFSLRVQVSQQDKEKENQVGATCVKEGGGDENALIRAWIDGSIGEGLRHLKLKLVWTWEVLSWNPSGRSSYSHSALCST